MKNAKSAHHHYHHYHVVEIMCVCNDICGYSNAFKTHITRFYLRTFYLKTHLKILGTPVAPVKESLNPDFLAEALLYRHYMFLLNVFHTDMVNV